MEVVSFLYTVIDGHQRIKKNALAYLKKLEYFVYISIEW